MVRLCGGRGPIRWGREGRLRRRYRLRSTGRSRSLLVGCMTMAAAAALCSAGSRDWSPREAAEAARRAENEYAGMQTGPMDQLTVGLGAEGHALLIDCDSLDVEPRPGRCTASASTLRGAAVRDSRQSGRDISRREQVILRPHRRARSKVGAGDPNRWGESRPGRVGRLPARARQLTP